MSGTNNPNNDQFSFKPEYNNLVRNRATPQQKQEKPEEDAFSFKPEYNNLVKKKVGGSGSDAYTFPTPSDVETPSLSPENIGKASEAYQNNNLTKQDLDLLEKTDFGKNNGLQMPEGWKDAFIQAHNGKKTSDLLNNVTGIINANYPQTSDPKLNQNRQEILKTVQSLDIPAITKIKQSIINAKQQQILKRREDIKGNLGSASEMYAISKINEAENDPQIKQWQQEIDKVKSTMDDFTTLAIVNKKENVAQVKAEMAPQNIRFKDALLSAQAIGEQMEKEIGINRTTPNVEYDRQRAGIEAIVNNFVMEANDLMTRGIKTKNTDLIKQAEDKRKAIGIYLDKYNNLDNQHPDVGVYKTARYLGDILAETNPNRLITTKADVNKAAKIAEERNPGFLKSHGKFVDIVAESEGSGVGALKSGLVPQGGFIGGLKSGVEDIGYSGAEFVASPFGMTIDEGTKSKAEHFKEEPQQKGTSKAGIQSTQIVYDKQNNAYRELPNEDYGQWNWNSSMYSLGKGIPTLAKWIAIDKGAGGLINLAAEGVVSGLNVVGKEIAATTNALIKSKDLAEGYEAIKLGKNFETTAGLYSATYVTGFDENRKLADNLIEDNSSMGEAKKNALAHILTLTTAGLFSMVGYSPTKAVESTIAKSVGPDVLKFLENTSFEKLSKDEMNSLIKDKIWPRVKAMAKAAGNNALSGAKLGGIGVIDQKIKDLAGIIVNPDKAKISTPSDDLHSIVDQTLLMTLVGLPGMINEGAFPHSSKDALYQSGLLWPQHVDRINELVEQGQIDPQKGSEMIAIAKTMGEEVAKAKTETNNEGLPLTTRQQRDLAVANFRKRAAAKMEESGSSVNAETINGESDKEIENIRSVNNWQKIEETPTFKSISQVDKEGAELGKPATMDEIDPTKKYSYLKDGETITTNGAKLITHLETGDIHDQSIKSEDKAGQTKEAESAKSPDQKQATNTEEKTVESAVIQIGDKTYEGKNHGEAIEKAAAAGEDISSIDREKDGKFKLSDGSIIDRKEAQKLFGADHSEQLIKQDQKPIGELTPEKKKEATEFANEMKSEGIIPDTYHGMITPEDATPFWQMVAQQAQNLDANWKPLEGDENKSEQAAIDAFGDTIVDYAKELYPKEDISSQLKSESNDDIKAEGGSQKEGNAQKSGEEVGQKTDEKGNVLTPQQGQEAEADKQNLESVVSPESAPVSDVKEPPPAEPDYSKEIDGEPPVVGIRDSIVNTERVNKGLKPLVKEFTRSWADNWKQIKNSIATGFSPRQFIESVNNKLLNKEKVVFDDHDYAVLLFDRLNIQNNIANARDEMEAARASGDEGAETAATDLFNLYSQQLEQNDIVGRQLKSTSGRALSAIQMMSKLDGELVSWSKDLNTLYRGQMPEKLKSFVERIEKEYKEKNEELTAHYEKELKKVAEEAFKKAKESVPRSTFSEEGQKKTANKRVAKGGIKLKGKELADKIRKLRPGTGSAQANIFGLPIAVYDTALVAIANAVEGGANLIDAINEAIKDIKFSAEKDRSDFIAHLQNVEEPESPQALRAGLLEDIKDIAKQNDATGLVPDAVKPLKKLMTLYIKEGVKSLDELVKKTYGDLKDTFPDIDEKEIRDAFSGYGIKPDSEAKVKSDLSKLRGEARAVSEYQELLKRPPGETKDQEFKRLTKAAEKYKKVQEYMHAMGIDEQAPPATEEGRKAAALTASKKRMKAIIDDLNSQIAAGERKQRNQVEPDTELDVLRAERERLSAQLDEIENAKLTSEQKIKQTEDALNRQIFNYEKQIKEGTNPLRPKEARPTTKQIEQLKKRRNELRKQVNTMREEMNPNTSAEQRALDRYNETLQKKIYNLEGKIENKDFDTEEKKTIDFSKDAKSLALEGQLKKLRREYYGLKRVGELANKSWAKKAMSLAAATKRAFVLSRIATFGRLGMAVTWNTIFKPTETASGLGLYAATKLGFARKLSQQADRYGISSLRDVKANIVGEKEAIKALGNPQTYRDFINDWKNGYSELSLMYDDKIHPEVPKELRDGWQRIEHGLGGIARGHGAVKGIAKRMEFNRAYVIRKEAAKRKGQDVNNPVVQYGIGAMAYQDAMRSILMENNKLSDKYQDWIDELEKGGFGSNALALTLQEMMPIVKIPTNLVLNAGRATLGTPLAGGVIAVRGMIELMSKGDSKYGISKLTPEQSDALLRNLRMGNVGMALMLAGYFAPNMFGASHFYQKGVEQPEGLEEGDVRFFGLKIPRWLADNPYLVTMKIGASLRNTFDYYHDEKDKNFAESAANALIRTGAGVVKETPVLGTPSEAIKWIEGNSGNWFWYSQVKSTLLPGILQEAAESSDNKDGWYKFIGGERIKRKPQSTWEAIKTGVPGLRQGVEQK